MKAKKSQHEIVGFVLIIIIVSVIGLIFLSFSIGRGERVEKTSVELSDFLQASLYYTTECGENGNYKDLQGLIKSCYKEDDCFGSVDACDVLNKTLSKLVRESFQVSDVSKNKAYELRIYYNVRKGTEVPLTSQPSSDSEEILFIEEGVFENCGSKAGASQAIFMNSGNINVELNFCYG